MIKGGVEDTGKLDVISCTLTAKFSFNTVTLVSHVSTDVNCVLSYILSVGCVTVA